MKQQYLKVWGGSQPQLFTRHNKINVVKMKEHPKQSASLSFHSLSLILNPQSTIIKEPQIFPLLNPNPSYKLKRHESQGRGAGVPAPGWHLCWVCPNGPWPEPLQLFSHVTSALVLPLPSIPHPHPNLQPLLLEDQPQWSRPRPLPHKLPPASVTSSLLATKCREGTQGRAQVVVWCSVGPSLIDRLICLILVFNYKPKKGHKMLQLWKQG